MLSATRFQHASALKHQALRTTLALWNSSYSDVSASTELFISRKIGEFQLLGRDRNHQQLTYAQQPLVRFSTTSRSGQLRLKLLDSTGEAGIVHEGIFDFAAGVENRTVIPAAEIAADLLQG